MRKRKFISMLISIAMVVTMTPFVISADPVAIEINDTNFPDANFKNYVSTNIDTSGDGYLDANEIANITSINVTDMSISTLQGIGYFTALTDLICDINLLTELDVSNNTVLETLSCAENNLETLNLGSNTQLRALYCSLCNLVSLDVTQNTQLEQLICDNNSIDTLNISNNEALYRLYCFDNDIIELDVSSIPALSRAVQEATPSDDGEVVSYSILDGSIQLMCDSGIEITTASLATIGSFVVEEEDYSWANESDRSEWHGSTVTGSLDYVDEATSVGFTGETHFLRFAVEAPAEVTDLTAATVAITGLRGAEAVTNNYTGSQFEAYNDGQALLVVWGVEENENTITIKVDWDGSGAAYSETTYTLDLSELTLNPEVTGPIESEATIANATLAETDMFAWANESDHSEWDGSTVTGSLDYVDEATSVGFTGETHFLRFAVEAPAEVTDLTAATVAITGLRGAEAVTNNYTGSQFEAYNDGQALLVVWGVEENENTITIKVDWDGSGAAYSETTYTLDLSELTLNPEVTGPIESEATIANATLAETDMFAWANESDHSEWDGSTVTGSLDYVDEATSVGFTGETHFLRFAVEAPAEVTDLTAATVAITGLRGAEAVTNNYTGSQFEAYNDGQALLVVWGVEENENTITIKVDWDGSGAAYSETTYTLDLSELTLNPEVTGPIESEATIANATLAETDMFAWANESDHSEWDGSTVTGSLDYVDEATSVGFTGETHFLRFAVEAPAEVTDLTAATVAITGLRGAEAVTNNYTGSQFEAYNDGQALLVVWGVEENENTITIKVDWDGSGAAYSETTYTLDLSELTLNPEVTGPIESEATIANATLAETDMFAWANESDHSEWDGSTVTGSLDYVDEATSVGFTGETHFLRFAVEAPAEVTDLTAATVAITGLRGAEAVTNNYTGSQFEAYNDGQALLVVWGVEENENTITIKVDWDGSGAAYSETTYTLDLSELTLNPEVTGPIESEATIANATLAETDMFAWANESDHSEWDGSTVTGSLDYVDEATSVGFTGETHFLRFAVEAPAEVTDLTAATVAITGLRGAEAVTNNYTGSQFEAYNDGQALLVVWGVEENENTITIKVDWDGSGAAYSETTYTLDLSELTLNPEVTPTPTPTVTDTPSVTPTVTDTPTVTPTVTDTPSVAPTVTDTPSVTPTVTDTPTVTPTVTDTPSVTPTVTDTPSVTPTVTDTPSVTPTVTDTPTVTPTVTDTPSVAPTVTVEPDLPSVNREQAESFVTRCYEIALGRAPELEGLTDWTDSLVDREISGSQFAYGIIFSPEFQNKDLSDEEYVEYLYLMLLDRPSDEEGKENWLSLLEGGALREEVFAGLVNSTEYFNLCSANGLNAGYYTIGVEMTQQGAVNGFVDRLYGYCLGRSGDQGGQQNWVTQLINGSATGAQVAYGFFFSPEFMNNNYSNEVFVTILYNVCLNRAPDPDGLNNWVTALDNGADRLEVFRGFAHSDEFTGICNNYGIVRGSI